MSGRNGTGLLESEMRCRLMSLVSENPGVQPLHLAGLAGMSKGAVTYHLRRMVRARLVVEHRRGLHVHLFEAGAHGPIEQKNKLALVWRAARAGLQ